MSTIALVTLFCNLSLGYDPEFLRVIKAMGQVESGNDPQAYNRKERAVGHLQIRPAYLADVNSFLRAAGQPEYATSDCRVPEKAVHMVYVYTSTWAKKKGWTWTAENIARLHVGGPNGPSRSRSFPYWLRVQSVLNKE